MAKKLRWTPSETIQIAHDEIGVAARHLDRLGDRGITAAFLDETRGLVEGASAALSGQPVRLGAQKGSTQAVLQAQATAGRIAVAIRGAVERVFPKRNDIHKVMGVGAVDPGASVVKALAAVEAVLEGAASYPAEVATAGVLPRDLDALRASRDVLRTSEGTQENAKDAKKAGTAARDDVLQDLTRRVDRILAAAELEFVEERDILAEFRGPIPTKTRTKKPPSEG